MSDSSFEYILQELQNQKLRMDDLQAENTELRRQLTDLRNGQGIFVEILGLRIPLAGTITATTSPFEELVQANAERQESYVAPWAAEVEEALEAPTMQMLPVTVEQSFPVMKDIPAIPETPRPDEEIAPIEEQATKEYLPAFASSFLDEDFEEDFASAATSQIAVWNGPSGTPGTSGAPTTPPTKPINEDEKATLRRELIGSFLLE